MAGGKTLPGTREDLPNDVAAEIDAKQRIEEHWRRAGTVVRETEDDPPRGARPIAEGEERPPSPLE